MKKLMEKINKERQSAALMRLQKSVQFWAMDKETPVHGMNGLSEKARTELMGNYSLIVEKVRNKAMAQELCLSYESKRALRKVGFKDSDLVYVDPIQNELKRTQKKFGLTSSPALY